MAEPGTINRSDGDIGNARRRGIHRTSRGANERVTVLATVTKFADPEADEECGSARDPVERGPLRSSLKDCVLVDAQNVELQYHNDV